MCFILEQTQNSQQCSLKKHKVLMRCWKMLEDPKVQNTILVTCALERDPIPQEKMKTAMEHSQGCGFVSHPSSFKGTKAKPFNKLESPIKHHLVPEVRNSLCWSGVCQNRQKFIRGSSQVRQVHQKFVRQLGRG